MAYTKTSWLEMSMTEAAKLTALNNCETQYDKITTYAASITHSLAYYTETYSDANFFNALNDGAGSGFIATTLDGCDYDEVQNIVANSSVEQNIILIWADTEATIPTGFKLCNGSNGTPNLLLKYPVAAGSIFSNGVGGGDNAPQVTGTVTISDHELTATEIPSHTHSYTDVHSDGVGDLTALGYGACDQADDSHSKTTSLGGSAHGHSATLTTDPLDIRPASMALCYIMKV